ncbi:MAG: NAD-glutamate dehydrogenase domain-containing protein, partial [Sciscionella sp.]
TDDMPYLVDSVMSELSRLSVGVHRLAHPIVVVRREVDGSLREIRPEADSADPPADTQAESWMYLETSPITDPDRAREIETRLASVLGDVREVIEDTDKMIDTARRLADSLRSDPPALAAVEISDGVDLLRWLADGHFTFLGYRSYERHDGEDDAGPVLRAVLASGLGVLRSDSLSSRGLTSGPDGVATALEPTLLVLAQAGTASSVHRSVYPYYVGVKTFDESGAVNGEHRFLGLFTTTALHENVLDIPVIRRRVRDIIHRAGFPLESYSGQKMLEVAQTYPRAELFSTDTDALYDIITGVIALAERRKVRLFLRRDPYGRFFSCLVYLPRDRYTTTCRLAMQDALLAELGGTSLEYSARVGETELARVHFMVYTDPNSTVTPDQQRLHRRLTDAARSWDDHIYDELDESGEGTASDTVTLDGAAAEVSQQVAAAFPDSYKSDFTAAQGLQDLRRLQALAGCEEEHGLDLSFYVPDKPEVGERRFKLYLAGERITLSAVLPVLQHMGVVVVDERPYEVTLPGGAECWIYDFGLRIEAAVLERLTDATLDGLRERFSAAFAAAWRGEVEVDGFNALVLSAGVTARQAAVLRAYTKYLRQAGGNFSQDYIEDAVLAHTSVATALIRLFETRFDPMASAEHREHATESLTEEISAMIDEVTSLDEDRILRSFLTLINATLRTNYAVRGLDENGEPTVVRPYLSFKLDPQQIPELPEPRPRFEIFVYSPRTEGVHLRFGAVARGGLRWSDRREDFRTEILGLVKAQAVKNAVIVPVGAKGGFVLKRPPAPTGDPGLDREAMQAEGIACYRMFNYALLELTDNLRTAEGVREVIPAESVVRYDADDTYLVVAADKGTASFSDIANEVAISHGYWLGDAFASGGSVGYDHKSMGITARGAWESVKRHFRELGVDTQTEEFSAVGIGDMSGDVFGNGMLCSRHIRLLAAFDHRHIFIDPAPDAAATFAERERMFSLPRSSWADYDRSLISAGGGIWPRSAKAIPISAEAARALGVEGSPKQLSPA